jgi:hypothetical protein
MQLMDGVARRGNPAVSQPPRNEKGLTVLCHIVEQPDCRVSGLRCSE